jgi:hypothetical protein
MIKQLALLGLVAQTGCLELKPNDYGGGFAFSWTLSGGTCDPTWKTSWVVQPQAGQAFDDVYTCSDGIDNSPAYVAGQTYTIYPSLIDAMHMPIDQEPPITVTLPASLLVLPTVNFDLGPKQDVTFTVQYGAAGEKNCDPTAMGGAGVAQQEIDLYDSGNLTCVATFPITGKDQLLRPINDTTCAPGRFCYENNIVETIPQIPAGNYTITVRGLKSNGGAMSDCYDVTQNFTVPVMGGDLGTLVAPLCPDPNTPDCTPAAMGGTGLCSL